MRNWSADWGNGVVLPKLLSEDQDRRRGMSFGEIPLRRFVFEIQFRLLRYTPRLPAGDIFGSSTPPSFSGVRAQ